MKKLLLTLGLLGWFAGPAQAQLGTPPYIFSPGTTILSAEVNANFTYVHDNALNRTGGTMSGTLQSRNIIPSSPNTYALGSASFPFQYGYFRTGIVFVGPSFSYNFAWSAPAADRAVTLEDPGGTDVFVWKAATQTLTNKTITAAVFSGTATGTYTFGGSGTWAGNAIGATVGGTGQTSITTGDVLYGSATNTISKLGIGTTGQILSVVAGVPAWQGANITLLKQGSGTATAGAAANVDTFALASSLTVKDTLLVVVVHQNTGSAANILPILQNSTDTVTVTNLTQANNNYYSDYAIITAHSTTLVASSVNNSGTTAFVRSTFTTAFTGNWTLALRHGGITGPDTWVWKWAIYKIAGQ
jgi:hypothetical protein